MDLQHVYTLEEYFDLDRTSEEKFEYWEGGVRCVSHVSIEHALIEVNVGAHLRGLLRERRCTALMSGMKVKVPDFPPYRYPDLSVYCGEGKFEKIGGLDVLTNPQMIIEVLSPSTEAFDRGDKFTYYKSILSLVEYLLVATNRPHVTLFIKQNETDWIQREATGMEGKLLIPSFGVELLLSEVYLDVEFPETPPSRFLDER